MKTYNGRTQPAPFRLFLLMKGQNAGKVSRQPFTNSLEIDFETEEAAERGYHAITCIYYANVFRRAVVGSVIPFLRIREVRDIFKQYESIFLEDVKYHQILRSALQLEEVKKKETIYYRAYIVTIAKHLITQINKKQTA